MGNADLPYTYRNSKKLAGGKWRDYWRFRRNGVDTPLPGAPGDKAFHTRYSELIAQAEQREEADAAKKADRHSFQWLCDSYLDSTEFKSLSEKTQDDYRKTIEDRLVPALGPERFDCINRASIKLIRDAVLKEGLSARSANKVKQVASLLYTWADDEELLPEDFINPGMKLKKVKGKSKPITIWSPEEIAHYLANCQPFMVTPVMLALYTGQRREDLVQMEWADCLGDIVRVRQNKTGEPLDIPCHPALKAHLASIRTKFGGAIIRAQDGKPMNAGSLSAAMNRAVAAIDGMPHRTMHGLRYAAAGALEVAGCTVAQIQSVIGHRTYQMAMQYARQRRDAEAAMARLQQSA